MKRKYILPIILLFVVLWGQTGTAHPGENQTCDNCHTYPSSLVNVTTNITNITIFNGDTVYVNVTWSVGIEDEKIAVKWPYNVSNNSQFNLTPVMVYIGTASNGTRISRLMAEDISPGDYIVRVYAAIGSPNETDYKNITVTVVGRSPVADAGGPYSGFVNESVTFNGSGSYDLDGNITNYTWDFGDGNVEEGMVIDHSYNSTGNYTVNLTVTDEDEATDTNSTTVVITEVEVEVNLPPVADAGGPYTGIVNELVTFNGSGSYDLDGNITNYTWDFGDGNVEEGMVIDHSYNASGNYTVTLTVTDEDEATDTNSTTVVITEVEVEVNLPPVADAGGPYTGIVNESVTFNGSGSYDLDGNITNYTWDFGDGNVEEGMVIDHSYNSSGNYTVTLTVTDENGANATDTTFALIEEGRLVFRKHVRVGYDGGLGYTIRNEVNNRECSESKLNGRNSK